LLNHKSKDLQVIIKTVEACSLHAMCFHEKIFAFSTTLSMDFGRNYICEPRLVYEPSIFRTVQ